MQVCICPFCQEPQRPMYLYTDAALQWLAQTFDEHHRRQRVYAFIELFYRAGECDPQMPYLVWRAVMGIDILPPFAWGNKIGAFQPPRDAEGQVLGVSIIERMWFNQDSHSQRAH